MATDVRPRSNRLLMVLGIVIAIVAFIAVILVPRGGGESTGARTADVVVAAVDVPAGQQISEQLMVIHKFPPDQVPTGAFTTIKTASGQFAAVALTKNTPLTSSNVVASVDKLPVQKKPYLDIPPGQVAISIPAGGELQAVGGFIQPDDRVDIIFNPAASSKPIWKTTYQNLRIAHVGPVGGTNQQGISTSFIVFVNLDDAEALSFLFGNGTYKFVLRSQKDAAKNDTTSTAGATSESFNAKFNIPK